jgi:hypothetical protein
MIHLKVDKEVTLHLTIQSGKRSTKQDHGYQTKKNPPERPTDFCLVSLITKRELLLLVPHHPKAFFPLVCGDLMLFSFSTARHS